MIKVIGIGLDGREGLPQKLQVMITEATVLVGSDRHLSYFPHHRAKRLSINNLNDTLNQIEYFLTTTEKIVILTSGDPLFFGLGRLLLEKFSPEKLEFYPHLSSVQIAFNQLKIPWQDAKLISVHGRHLDELIKILPQGYSKIAILTDQINNPEAIINLYLALDLPIHYDIYIAENLGSTESKITQINLDHNIKNNFSQVTYSELNVVIFIKNNPSDNQINLEKLPCFGLPDQIFSSFPDRPGLMTKKEIRMLILGELALHNNQIIWDIGAGTGSVSLEIARLCPNSQIYAIEKTVIGNNLIIKNSQKLQISNVIPIQGKAPQILATLPPPDRIFIGGSGGNLSSILDFCQAKIKAQGIIVFALATLEHFSLSLAWLKENQWYYQVKQVQISRSIPVSNLTRFSPLNPVNLIIASCQELDNFD
jgi:precorrin-6Y C5,15-methyltransferase (decarboxylating)